MRIRNHFMTCPDDNGIVASVEQGKELVEGLVITYLCTHPSTMRSGAQVYFINFVNSFGGVDQQI